MVIFENQNNKIYNTEYKKVFGIVKFITITHK